MLFQFLKHLLWYLDLHYYYISNGKFEVCSYLEMVWMVEKKDNNTNLLLAATYRRSNISKFGTTRYTKKSTVEALKGSIQFNFGMCTIYQLRSKSSLSHPKNLLPTVLPRGINNVNVPGKNVLGKA